jgi:hypothetical protein
MFGKVAPASKFCRPNKSASKLGSAGTLKLPRLKAELHELSIESTDSTPLLRLWLTLWAESGGCIWKVAIVELLVLETCIVSFSNNPEAPASAKAPLTLA